MLILLCVLAFISRAVTSESSVAQATAMVLFVAVLTLIFLALKDWVLRNRQGPTDSGRSQTVAG
jgi:hypothetical protein